MYSIRCGGVRLFTLNFRKNVGIVFFIIIILCLLFISTFSNCNYAYADDNDVFKNSISLNKGNDYFYPSRATVEKKTQDKFGLQDNQDRHYEIANNNKCNVYGFLKYRNDDDYKQHFGSKNQTKNRKIDNDGRVHFDSIIFEYKDYAKDGYIGDFKSKNTEKDDFPLCIYGNSSFLKNNNANKSITYIDSIKYESNNNKLVFDSTVLGNMDNCYNWIFSGWFNDSVKSIEWADTNNDSAREIWYSPLCCAVYDTDNICIAKKNIFFNGKGDVKFSYDFNPGNSTSLGNFSGYCDNDEIILPKGKKIKRIEFTACDERINSRGNISYDYELKEVASDNVNEYGKVKEELQENQSLYNQAIENNSESSKIEILKNNINALTEKLNAILEKDKNIINNRNKGKFFKDGVFYEKIGVVKDYLSSSHDIYGCIEDCSKEDFYKHYMFGVKYYDSIYIDLDINNYNSNDLSNDKNIAQQWIPLGCDEDDKFYLRLYHENAFDYKKFIHETHCIDDISVKFSNNEWRVSIDDECSHSARTNNKSYFCSFQSNDGKIETLPINIEKTYGESDSENKTEYNKNIAFSFNRILLTPKSPYFSEYDKYFGDKNHHKGTEVNRLYPDRVTFESSTSKTNNFTNFERYYLIAENQYVWAIGHIKPCSEDEYSKHFSTLNTGENRLPLRNGIPYFDEIIFEFKESTLNEANTIGKFYTSMGEYDTFPARYYVSDKTTLDAYQHETNDGTSFFIQYINDIKYTNGKVEFDWHQNKMYQHHVWFSSEGDPKDGLYGPKVFNDYIKPYYYNKKGAPVFNFDYLSELPAKAFCASLYDENGNFIKKTKFWWK